MPVTNCPTCGQQVSPKAYDCPHCGHPLRKLRRGPFGLLAKWVLILFNLAMIALLFLHFGSVGEVMDGAASEAERAGAAVGGTLGLGLLLFFWVLGDIILGLVVMLTKPSK